MESLSTQMPCSSVSYHSNQDIFLAAAPSEEQNRLPLLQRVYTFELHIYQEIGSWVANDMSIANL